MSYVKHFSGVTYDFKLENNNIFDLLGKSNTFIKKISYRINEKIISLSSDNDSITINGTSSFPVASNTAATHSGQINGAITVSGATNLNIQASVASGTITPKKGSFIRVIEYSAGTVGNTA